jgi:hypothetical protein
MNFSALIHALSHIVAAWGAQMKRKPPLHRPEVGGGDVGSVSTLEQNQPSTDLKSAGGRLKVQARRPPYFVRPRGLVAERRCAPFALAIQKKVGIGTPHGLQ